MSKRPVNICSGQFGDLSLEELCRTMKAIGYDGFELAAQSHVDVFRIVNDPVYRDSFRETLANYGMGIGAIHEVLTCREIVEKTVAEFNDIRRSLAE